MKVTIIEHTQNAKELLIFSKKTRLKMSPEGFSDIMNMSEEDKQKELDYVFGTIGSSWEFVGYTIMIEGVTRAFTHQLVRHRHESFAQQAQRVVNVSDSFEYLATGSVETSELYHEGMSMVKDIYSDLISGGAHPQDARGILPTNIKTNILMKINLRSLSNLLGIRLCVKAQGEFQEVAREIQRKVLEIHPWAEPVLRVHCAQHGSCAFPGYEDCPVKKAGLIPVADKESIKKVWEKNRAEYQPKGE